MDRCFVYIQLPQSLETVTCGRYSQERTSGGDVVGRFVYGRRYRTRPDAVPIDPLHLPIADITFETYKLGGIFGALRDASPDAWGRRVIERALGRTDVGEIDYLLNSPETELARSPSASEKLHLRPSVTSTARSIWRNCCLPHGSSRRCRRGKLRQRRCCGCSSSSKPERRWVAHVPRTLSKMRVDCGWQNFHHELTNGTTPPSKPPCCRWHVSATFEHRIFALRPLPALQCSWCSGLIASGAPMAISGVVW